MMDSTILYVLQQKSVIVALRFTSYKALLRDLDKMLE